MTTKPKTTESPPRLRRRRSRPRRGPADGSQPVPLHKRVLSHFQKGDRQRGSDYFHEGRIHLEVEGPRARARADGTEQDSYAVGVDWSMVASERKLHAFCECQRFAKGNPCKHVWATLLSLAEAGPQNQPAGGGRLSLRKDRAASWTDLGIDVEAIERRNRESEAANRARPNRRKARARSGRGRRGDPDFKDAWRSQLAALHDDAESLIDSAAASLVQRETPDIRFLVNTSASLGSGGLVLDIFEHRPGAGREAGKPKRADIDPEALSKLLLPDGLPEHAEGQVPVVAAYGSEPPRRQGRGRRPIAKSAPSGIQRFRLPRSLYDPVLPHLCAEGVLGWWDGRALNNRHALSWDNGSPWRLVLQLEMVDAGMARLRGGLERNGENVALSAPVLVLLANDSNGDGDGQPGAALVLFSKTISYLETSGAQALPWVEILRDAGEIVIPKEDLEEALASLLEIPGLPRLEAPDELQLTFEGSGPEPRLVLVPDPASTLPDPPLLAKLSFRYGPLEVSAGDPRTSIIDWQEGTFLRRDMDEEHRALVRLLELEVRPIASRQGHELELDPQQMPAVAEPLLADGWTVEVHGTSLRSASPPALRVESGIDWFELSGGVDFAGDEVDLKEVIDAISRGDRFVTLGDGSRGLLPAAWVETYDSLAKLSHGSEEEGLRFLPSQALLVDALLAAMPPANVDAQFAELRQKLRTMDRIKPKTELRSFQGTLRNYQRQGLGWLFFLREFGLGGVLADDMGLGKTVQVLALLQACRTPARTTKLPFLVVAPRSLIYNWVEEAARFTPKMRVVEYAGADREALRDRLTDFDLVVTTYGTLRRDIGFLASQDFDTVILDEAQAIKNRDSQAAKASRLLQAQHRLALTGTPIENHLGELGSIFEFLNPDFFGRLPRLDALAGGRKPSQQELALVAEGIRPFILRRSKAEVLPDLPPKTEQTLHTDLNERQRELYDQLRAHYQSSLLAQVESQGMSGSSIQVLEALLRLRQVACHPGLVNEEWEEAGSAKLETLFDHVAEVLDEGHKVLVFSQFTKLLAYVRKHLDAESVPYAYLDGQTRDRGEVVERFQTDDDCNLFLISLKAGGTGLNLTAAEYVFLLDPWWNPAVEAQAIDRAHRIGQTEAVFAYRLIAQDTVEEKILELQSSKRQLADAILEADTKPLRDLTSDDLRMLLS